MSAGFQFGQWAAEFGLDKLEDAEMRCTKTLLKKLWLAAEKARKDQKRKRGDFDDIDPTKLEFGTNFVERDGAQHAFHAYLEGEALKELRHKPQEIDNMEDQLDRTCDQHLKTSKVDMNEFCDRAEREAKFEGSRISEILRQFHIAFTRDKSEVKDEIILELVDKTPVNIRPFPCTNPVKREQMRQILNRMIDEGKVSKSTSDYCSPAFIVPKKNGTGRLLLDCRELNKRLRNNAFPIPRIQGLLDKMALKGAIVKSTLDFSDFFFQHPLHKDSRRLLAFDAGIGAGLMELNALAQGLVVSPAFAQEKLQSLLDIDGVAVYVDDIIIFSKTVEEHRRILSEVLRRIGAAGYKLNHAKCEFFKEEVTWLGMKIGKNTINPCEDYVEKLRQVALPQSKPKDLKDVKRILGLLAFYARFCSDFAKRAEPIVRLTRKGTHEAWGEDQAKALNEIIGDIAKNALTLPDYEAMMHPDPQKRRPLVLCTDASDVGIGAWLGQRNEEGTMMTIAFESKTFAKEQRNWDTCNREYFGFVWSVNKFRTYLEGAFFEAFTDNAALVPILARKHFESPKQARWALRLQEFDFRLRHLPGAQNKVADAASRNELAPLVAVPPADEEAAAATVAQQCDSPLDVFVARVASFPGEEEVERYTTPFQRLVEQVRAVRSRELDNRRIHECELNMKVDDVLGPFDPSYLLLSSLKWFSLKSSIARVQAESPDVKQLWKFRTKLSELPESNQFYAIRSKLQFLPAARIVYVDKQGFLIPQEAEMKVLRAHHGDVVTHISIEGMRKNMRHLYLADKDKKINEYVQNCPACLQHHRTPLPPPRSFYPDGRGECLALDLLELTWEDAYNEEVENQFSHYAGKLYVFVGVDVATKWPTIKVLTNKRAETIANVIVNDVVPVTGVPLRVLSDLGSEFIGDVTSNLFTALDIEHNTISKGNKGGNGIVENMNGQVRKRLTRLIRQFPRDWRWKTGIVLHDLRTSGMPSLANLSPAQLLLGMQPRTLWAAEWTADKVADMPSDTRAWYQDVAQTVQFLASKAHRLKGDNASNRRLDAIARGARDTEFRRGDRVLAATDASVKSKRLDAPKFSLATVIEPLDPKQSGDKSLVLVFDADPGNPRRIPVDFVKKLEPAMLERLDSLPNPQPFQES